MMPRVGGTGIPPSPVLWTASSALIASAMVDSDVIMVVWFDADASPPPALPVVRSARVESHWNTQAAPSVTVVLAAVSLRAQTAKAPATNSVGI